MSLVRRLFAAHPSNPPQWLVDMFGGAPSATGLAITPDSAESVATVFACVKVLSETMGTVPIHLYRQRAGGGKERVQETRLAELLTYKPNPWQTASEFKEMLTAHAALRGMGLSQIVYRNSGEIEMLVPLHPDRCTFRNHPADGRVVCDYSPKNGGAQTFELWELFRIVTNSTDGITGRSPITVARETVGLALAAEEFGARFFSGGARPAGVLKYPGKLSKEAKERLKDNWSSLYGGLANANKTAILEEGLDYTQVGMKLDDAQFLETRKHQRSDIAGLWRVPPHMVGDLERSTNNNIEQQSLEFVQYTMLPWFVRWEQAVGRDLLSAEDVRARIYAKCQEKGLLRGDSKSRFEGYGIGRQWGWMSVNDIRELEDMNPLAPEIGDVYLQPANMVPAGTLSFPTRDQTAAAVTAQVATAHRDLLAESLRRAARRAAQVREKHPQLEGHAEFIAGAVTPVLQAFADILVAMKGLDQARARSAAEIFAKQRAVATAELSVQLGDPEEHDWPAEATAWLRDLTTLVLTAAPALIAEPIPA